MGAAFDRAFALLKEGEPVVEFGGNDRCEDCGEKMRQVKMQLGFGYPVVYGYECPHCEYFKPHDEDYAHTEQIQTYCGKCEGSGGQDEYNEARDSYECDACDGTGEASR